MIFSDLASPAEAGKQDASSLHGFAQAGNRYPLFGIMLRPKQEKIAGEAWLHAILTLSDQSIAPQHKEIFAGIDLYQSGMLAIVPNSLVGENAKLRRVE